MKMLFCPKCNRKLSNVNAWHYCKDISIDDLFASKSDDILLIFDRVLQAVVDWEDVAMSATKNCVVFVHHKTFLVVKPMTKFLEIKFYSDVIIDDDSLYKFQLWNSKYEGVLRLSNEHELNHKHVAYIKKSYQIS